MLKHGWSVKTKLTLSQTKSVYPMKMNLVETSSRPVASWVSNNQSWARTFFYASRLRFRALWQSSSRWRFRALFWALNFALLRSRFRAPKFFVLFFALLDFSRSDTRNHGFSRS